MKLFCSTTKKNRLETVRIDEIRGRENHRGVLPASPGYGAATAGKLHAAKSGPADFKKTACFSTMSATVP